MPKPLPLPSQDVIKRNLAYDPETGLFTWIIARPGVPIGKTAGSLKKSGYVTINVEGQACLAHRLAYVYMTGSCPEMVDHDDRDRSNNRWKNLKTTTNGQNMHNTSMSGDKNSTGYKGVHVNGKRFSARIEIDGARVNLGTYDTAEQAHERYREAHAFFNPKETTS